MILSLPINTSLQKLLAAATVFLGMAAPLSAAPTCGLAVEPRQVPSPAFDAPLVTNASAPEETIVLAGGCFWGIQAVFQHVKGVRSAVSGYAGGEAHTARYDEVSRGTTEHAEAVKVTYNPTEITVGTLLKIFFTVAHDPTQLNRQGVDHGTQYRSAIFYTLPVQEQVASRYIAQLTAANVYEKPIVTTIEPLADFYAAEAYHQDYARRNPTNPYIVQHDIPKVDALAKTFPDLYH